METEKEDEGAGGLRAVGLLLHKDEDTATIWYGPAEHLEAQAFHEESVVPLVSVPAYIIDRAKDGKALLDALALHGRRFAQEVLRDRYGADNLVGMDDNGGKFLVPDTRH